MNVDTPSPITHVSLCAGYGGIDLGLKRAIPSLRTIAFSEIEAFACANLVSKMEAGLLDPAPIWTDLKTFPWSEFHGCVDILSGGYPCQPFSAAGKRLGAEDPRHLWPHISAGIAAMRPSCCFFENVEGHISLGLPNVLQDLAGMGYRTTWCVASASECGAPHQRKRVFILAHANGSGDAQSRLQLEDLLAESSAAKLADSQCAGLEGFHNGHPSTVAAQYVGADPWASGERGAWEGCGELADTNANGSLDEQQPKNGWATGATAQCGSQAWPSRPGEQQFAWEPPRVVVDAKSQRAGQRSELRSKECGSRGALPWDVEQSGEVRGVPNASHNGLEIDSECAIQPAEGRGRNGNAGRVCPREAMGNAPQRQDHGREPGDMGLEASQGRCGDHAVGGAGEVLGHAGSQRCEQAECDVRGEQQAGGPAEECGLGVAEAMGNAAQLRRTRLCEDNETIIAEQLVEPADSSGGQTQPSMGLLLDGSADGLGGPDVSGLSDQELAEIRQWMVTSTNRTDSLRLLGNGVCVPTVERAFRVLVGELVEHQP